MDLHVETMEQPRYYHAPKQDDMDLLALFNENENPINSQNATLGLENSSGMYLMPTINHDQEEYFQDVLHTLEQFDYVFPSTPTKHGQQMGVFAKKDRKRAFDEISDVTVSTSGMSQDSPPQKKLRKQISLKSGTYSRQLEIEKKAGKWSQHEDELLRIAVKQFQEKQWKKISTLVPGRDHVQCLQRWQKVLRPGLQKGAWGREEDAILQETIESVGGDLSKVNWVNTSKLIKGRTPKQCRERWTLSLDPSINRGPWNSQEDAKILQLQKTLGSRWSEIKKMFNNRTENQIKTRFHTLKKKVKGKTN